jgi:nucleotide-binding universal stress UspA family protein
MIKKRILVPVNFGTQSDAALKYASYFAGVINGMITCLHVIEEPGFITGKFISKDIKDQIRREAGQRLSEKVNANINDKHIPFEIIVSAGKVHRKIMEKANDIKAEFIIMGRSDSQDLKNKPMGSNTKKVITQAKIPVITVGNRKPLEKRQILLPLDLSKPVYLKMLKAIQVARLLKIDVNIFTVLRSDWKSLEAKFRGRLNEIKEVFNNAGVACRVNLIVSKNPVYQEIISFAKSTRAALILIMTQQETEFTDLYIGSAAQEIINQSEIPVLSIRPEGQTDAYPDDTLIGRQLDPISIFNFK